MGVDPGGTTGVVVWSDEFGSERRISGQKGAVPVHVGGLLMWDELKPSAEMHDALEIPGKYDGSDWRAGEYMVVMQIFGLLEKYAPIDLIACEDFILRDPKSKQGDSGWSSARVALSPARICAQIDLMSRVVDTGGLGAGEGVGIPIVWQQASMAKTTYTDARLKAAGCYLPGKKHARDATRHALLAYKRLRTSNTARGGGRVQPRKVARGGKTARPKGERGVKKARGTVRKVKYVP